jgi:hypothetical protein
MLNPKNKISFSFRLDVSLLENEFISIYLKNIKFLLKTDQMKQVQIS